MITNSGSSDATPGQSQVPDSCTLPWIPLPTNLVSGQLFTIYRENLDLEHQKLKEAALVQLDVCGFFLYWYSEEKQDLHLIDTATIEDVEAEAFEMRTTLKNPKEFISDSTFETKMHLRIQCSNIQEVVCRKFSGVENKEFKNNGTPCTIFLCPNDSECDTVVWQDTLIQIAFRYRSIQENLPSLELLHKQWIYLTLVYDLSSSKQACRQSHSPEHRKVKLKTIPACCIAMALGASQAHSELPSLPLKDFTFDLFFNLFLQSWPREEIADLFTAYSDNFSLMNHTGLQEFLKSTISKSLVEKLPAVSRQSRIIRPRKIKHVNLMNYEARHFYRTPTRAESQKNINTQGSKLPRPSNNRVNSSRSRSEQRCKSPPRLHGLSAGGASSPRQVPNLHNQRSRNNFQSEIKLSPSDFRSIVQRYETDPAAKHQRRLSAQGFYRFLLSRDYMNLTRFWTFNEDPNQHKQRQIMRHPLAHYFIQCAQVSVQQEPPSNSLALDNGMDNHLTDSGLRNKTEFVRAIRQLLLLGTRCLILDCWTKNVAPPQASSGPFRPRHVDSELFVSPSFNKIAFGIQDSEVERNMRNSYAVPFEMVLQVIKKTAFVITQYPLILVLRVPHLSAQDQCQLGGLLQEYFGDSLLCPPLPKFEMSGDQSSVNMERYYGQTHQPLSSPENLKNKILLNLTLIEYKDQKLDQHEQSHEQRIASREESHDNSSFDKTESNTVQLTVFVTDPEGEEGLPKHDTSSIGSTGHFSTTGIRPAVQTRTTGSRLEYIKSSYSGGNATQVTFKPILKNRSNLTATSQQMHPRLARLISLPAPEPVPKGCLELFKLHRSNSLVNLSPAEPTPTIKLHRSVSENTTDLLQRRAGIQNMEASKAEFAQSEKAKTSENTLEIISCLASLKFARTVQLEHRARKKRLLQRLYSEAYKNRSRRSRLRKQDEKHEAPGPGKSDTPGGKGQKVVEQPSGGTRKGGLRSWLNKRTNTTAKSPDAQSPKKRPSLLQVASNAARRLSNVSMLKPEEQSSRRSSRSGLEMLMRPQLANNMKAFCRRLSTRSSVGSQQRSPMEKKNPRHALESKESSDITSNSISTQEQTRSRSDSSSNSSGVFNDLLRIPSITSSKDGSKKRISSTGSNDLQSNKLSGNGKKKKRSCARCSCSSGSRTSIASSSESLPMSSRRKHSSKDSTTKSEPAKSLRNRQGSTKLPKPQLPRSNPHSPRPSNNSHSSDKQYISYTSTSSTSSSTETEETSFSSTDSSDLLNDHPNRTLSPSEADLLTDSMSSSDEQHALTRRPPLGRRPFPNHAYENGQVRTGTLPSSFHQMPSAEPYNPLQSVSSNVHWASTISELNGIKGMSTLGLKDTTTSPSQLMWRQTNQWLAKCRLVVSSVAHVLDLVKSKTGTKALAEYTKNRLVAVLPTDMNCNWQTRQILQLIGCQLVPMQVELSGWTVERSEVGTNVTSFHSVPSVRKQIVNLYSIEQVKMNHEPITIGYTLKPARLRMDTCIHTHRYPKEWLLRGLPTTTPDLNASDDNSLFPTITATRWPTIPCGCCYDPFSEQRERDRLRQLHRYRYGKTSTSTSKSMYNSLLPWNISFQILRFMNNFNTEITGQSSKTSTQQRTNVNMASKLPRRYQRAASSACQPDRNVRDQLLPHPKGSLEDISNSYKAGQQEHSKIASDDCQLTTTEPELQIEAELLGPCSQVPQETGFNTQQRLEAITSPRLKRSAVSHAHTMQDIRTMASHFPTSPSLTQAAISSAFYRSYTSLYASNVNIVDSLGAMNIGFSRLPSPEAIVIRFSAHLQSSGHESQDKAGEGMAIRLFSTTSPVENTGTGYQHLKLSFDDSSSDARTLRNWHEACHEQLRSTLGLWIFCKIDLAVHAPLSLGELVDTVSQELSSRANSLTRSYNAGEKRHGNNGFMASLYNVKSQSRSTNLLDVDKGK